VLLKYCPKCGTELADSALYCKKCGTEQGQYMIFTEHAPSRINGIQNNKDNYIQNSSIVVQPMTIDQAGSFFYVMLKFFRIMGFAYIPFALALWGMFSNLHGLYYIFMLLSSLAFTPLLLIINGKVFDFLRISFFGAKRKMPGNVITYTLPILIGAHYTFFYSIYSVELSGVTGNILKILVALTIVTATLFYDIYYGRSKVLAVRPIVGFLINPVFETLVSLTFLLIFVI